MRSADALSNVSVISRDTFPDGDEFVLIEEMSLISYQIRDKRNRYSRRWNDLGFISY